MKLLAYFCGKFTDAFSIAFCTEKIYTPVMYIINEHIINRSICICLYYIWKVIAFYLQSCKIFLNFNAVVNFNLLHLSFLQIYLCYTCIYINVLTFWVCVRICNGRCLLSDSSSNNINCFRIVPLSSWCVRHNIICLFFTLK